MKSDVASTDRAPPEVRWRLSIDNPPLKSIMLPESGDIVTLDQQGVLYRTSALGQTLWRRALKAPASTVAVSLDGSTVVVPYTNDRLLVLDHRGHTVRKVRVPEGTDGVIALALDLFGQRLAMWSRDGRGTLMDEHGRTLATVELEFALGLLCFVGGAPLWVGAASFGEVVMLDYAGRVRWTDRLKVNIGSIAVSGNDSIVLVAGFATGVHRYNSVGQHEGAYLLSGATHRVAVCWDGQQFVAATERRQLVLMTQQGHQLWTFQTDGDIVDVGIDALARRAFCSTAEGELVYVDLVAPEVPLARPSSATQPQGEDTEAKGGTSVAVRPVRELSAAWVHRLSRRGRQVKDVQMALSPCGGYAALVGRDRRLQVLGPDGKHAMPPEDVAGKRVRLQAAADNPRFLAGSAKDVVWVDPQAGSVTRPGSGLAGTLAVRLGVDGRHVGFAYQDGTLRLLRADASPCWEGRPDKSIRRMNITRNGHLAILTRRWTVRLFDAEGQCCLEVPRHRPTWRFLMPCGTGLALITGDAHVLMVDAPARPATKHHLHAGCDACQVLGSACVMRLEGDAAVVVAPDGTLSEKQSVPTGAPVWRDASGSLSWIQLDDCWATGYARGGAIRWTFEASAPLLDAAVTHDGRTALLRSTEAVYCVRIAPEAADAS